MDRWSRGGKSQRREKEQECGPGGSQSRLAKTAGAEMRDQKLHAGGAKQVLNHER